MLEDTFGVHIAETLYHLPEHLQYFYLFNTILNEVSEGAVGTKFNEYVDSVLLLNESIVAHDVGVDQRRQSLKSLYLTLVSLALHGLDGHQTITFNRVSAEHLAKSALAKETVRVEIELLREFYPAAELSFVDLAHKIITRRYD